VNGSANARVGAQKIGSVMLRTGAQIIFVIRTKCSLPMRTVD
jgi:hypothetical protein